MTERKNTATLRLYENESELFTFKATVISCKKTNDSFQIILNRTAFFPTGGGQSCDTGTLGDVNVTDVRLEDGQIIHITDSYLETGSEVTGIIDSKERTEKMQSHSAEHILSSVLFKRYGLKNVGFHLGSIDTTCDFDDALSYVQLCEAEDEVNRIIREDHIIYPEYPSGSELGSLNYRSKLELTEDVRIVAIGKDGEIDRCACCAPHVTSTGKIGFFLITDHYRYKGGTRVHILTGQRALDKVRSDREGIKELSSMLSAKPNKNDVLSAVEALNISNKNLKKELDDINLMLNESICSSIYGNDAVIFDKRNDGEALRRLSLLAKEKVKGPAAVFGGEDGNYRFVFCGEKSRELFDTLRSLFNAKGGGKDVICGNISAKKEDIISSVHIIIQSL